MKDKKLQYLLGTTRIAIGWIFLWSFLDKFFGLMATNPGEAWLAGASPTTGFLQHATRGPFVDIFQSMAGSPVVDWLFMLGLLGIGTALIFGIVMRVACWSGVIMTTLMWLAVLPPEYNPLFGYHFIYTLIFLILLFSESGRYIGLADRWQKSSLVEKYKLLK